MSLPAVLVIHDWDKLSAKQHALLDEIVDLCLVQARESTTRPTRWNVLTDTTKRPEGYGIQQWVPLVMQHIAVAEAT